jgi:hypothetical protein
MIVNKQEQMIESNLPMGENIGFGIDESSMDLVMDILSKLYAYPIRTLVQEYICNGRDAMREAGTWGKRPIEVSVPNRLEPSFKVRDYGVGISPDRMSKVFVKYGSSTKRDSNLQTGGFGIGSKSFRCYTDSMSVTSFIDGIKYTYLINPKGVLPLAQEKTNEANGVEISIGVKSNDVHEFRNAVQRCIKYWSEPVKLFGVSDGEITQAKAHLTLDNLTAYVASEDNGTFYLVDGIQYNLIEVDGSNSYRYDRTQLHTHGFVVAINLPNGSLKLASSRERVEKNDENDAFEKKTIDAAKLSITRLLNKNTMNNNQVDDMVKFKADYACFYEINKAAIPIGYDFKLDNGIIRCPHPQVGRAINRTRRGKESFVETRLTSIALEGTVVCNVMNDREPNTLAKRLNHYLDTNRDVKQLVIIDTPNQIPHIKLLFKNSIDSLNLPKPLPKARNSNSKSAGDSYVYRLMNNGSPDMMIRIDTFNKEIEKWVMVEEVTPEAKELSRFMKVARIPKCNKKMVTIKGITVEQGQKILLARHTKDVIGLQTWQLGFEKLDVLSKFTKITNVDSNLRTYLLKLDPTLVDIAKKTQDNFAKIELKYPLISVLKELGSYSNNSRKIIVDEINKQSKGIK